MFNSTPDKELRMKQDTVIKKAKLRAILYAVLFVGGVYINLQLALLASLVGAFVLFTLVDVGRWYRATQ